MSNDVITPNWEGLVIIPGNAPISANCDDACVVLKYAASVNSSLQALERDIERQSQQLHFDLVIVWVLLAALVIGRLFTWCAWGDTAGKIHAAMAGVRGDLAEHGQELGDIAADVRRTRKILRWGKIRETARHS